jgi:hypothetical protein
LLLIEGRKDAAICCGDFQGLARVRTHSTNSPTAEQAMT